MAKNTFVAEVTFKYVWTYFGGHQVLKGSQMNVKYFKNCRRKIWYFPKFRSKIRQLFSINLIHCFNSSVSFIIHYKKDTRGM